MKTSKLFTLDVDVAERLKQESNASNLVNRLLTEHFSIKNRDKRVEKQLRIKQLKTKMKQINQELKVEDALKELKVDDKCIAWIRGNYPNIHPIMWRDYCRSRGLDLNLSKIIEIIKKNEWVLDRQ